MPKTKSGRRQPAAGAPTTRAHVRASTAAIKASSSTQKRAKRTTETTVTETSHEPSLPTTSTAQQEALLSPQFMETLVSRVADEVSRRLSPAETPAVIPPVVPSALNEVPVCPLANSESVGNLRVVGSSPPSGAYLKFPVNWWGISTIRFQLCFRGVRQWGIHFVYLWDEVLLYKSLLPHRLTWLARLGIVTP